MTTLIDIPGLQMHRVVTGKSRWHYKCQICRRKLTEGTPRIHWRLLQPVAVDPKWRWKPAMTWWQVNCENCIAVNFKAVESILPKAYELIGSKTDGV